MRTSPLGRDVVGYLKQRPALQSGVYWLAATLAGVSAVAFAVGFEFLEQSAQWMAQEYLLLYLILAPCCLLAASWIVREFAPAASGSGIPQVMAAISADSSQCTRWVGFRICVVKGISALLCVLGGGVIGREGPTIQIAAGIFHGLGRRFQSIWPQINHQSLLVAGGAAGIAAAFNTPLGGIVYAIEELSAQNFHRFKTMLITAVIVAGVVAQALQGPYLYFGFPKLPVITFSVLPWALVIGAIVGASGGLFGILLFRIQRLLRTRTMEERLRFTVCLGIILPLVGWALGGELLGGGTELIQRLLFQEDTSVPLLTIAGRFLGPLATYATGAAGGVFAPSLATGAAMGGKLALWFDPELYRLFVVLGMIAFLSGVTRAPFTAFVLVLEMTDRHSAIFAMMLTALVATLAAKLFEAKSFYERVQESLLAETKPGASTPQTDQYSGK